MLKTAKPLPTLATEAGTCNNGRICLSDYGIAACGGQKVSAHEDHRLVDFGQIRVGT